jgi:hypothetical protein
VQKVPVPKVGEVGQAAEFLACGFGEFDRERVAECSEAGVAGLALRSDRHPAPKHPAGPVRVNAAKAAAVAAALCDQPRP